MKKIIKKILLNIKNKGKKISIGKNCNIGLKTVFEGMNVIHEDTIFNGFIGYGSYVGSNCNLSGKIGRFCSIAPRVLVAQGSHPVSTFVSTHPTFFSMLKQNGETFVKNQKFNELEFADDKKNCIIIGNDVWIGTNVTILSGVKIGDGAIIAAGSVVIKDVEPYAIVGGVPAKTIRYRFNAQQIEHLLELQWWNKEIAWIRQNAKYFEDIEAFLMFNQKDHGVRSDD